ncbi:MAG: MFS transporter [Alphaproteobacteria bacterium]|nr:MFS transporter [Alphaproteobacteria bacterium]
MKPEKSQDSAKTAVSARGVALDIVTAVLRKGRLLDEALASGGDSAGNSGENALDSLASRDRAFVRLLVATVLRRLGQVDAALGHCLERPLPHKATSVHDILRLGATQLLFLETPPHAAVDTSVELARSRGFAPHLKLINAILRRISREGAALITAQDAPRLNTPDWLWESWVAAYGEDQARAIATAHMAEPPLDLSVTGDPGTWAEKLGGTVLATGTVRLAKTARVTEMEGFAEGKWWVQDAASALPVRLLGDVAGKNVLDLCAAPGGKTLQLASAGAHVTALDRSRPRLARLEENLGRLHLEAEMICADAVTWRPQTLAGAVLLDAPCTATGGLRRHPDVARLKTPEDVARLAALADRLLDAALDMLEPGGRLVFCTCSLEPQEGPERTAAFLQRADGVKLVPITPEEIGGLTEAVTGEGYLRTLPCHFSGQGGMDGFFAARFEKARK